MPGIAPKPTSSTYSIQVIVSTEGAAAFTLDEILGNATELVLVEHTTDSHGQTLAPFTGFDLVGLRLSPWTGESGREASVGSPSSRLVLATSQSRTYTIIQHNVANRDQNGFVPATLEDPVGCSRLWPPLLWGRVPLPPGSIPIGQRSAERLSSGPPILIPIGPSFRYSIAWSRAGAIARRRERMMADQQVPRPPEATDRQVVDCGGLRFAATFRAPAGATCASSGRSTVI